MAHEGSAHLVATEGVFYSPLQRLQRDVTIEVIRQHQLDRQRIAGPSDVCHSALRILDTHAGTGVRAIRYALELSDMVTSVTANDVSPAALAALHENVRASFDAARRRDDAARCGTESAPLPLPEVRITSGDANALLAASPGAFDVVDVDPCGSPSAFLAAAVRAVRLGGLLCVVCTDFHDLSGVGGGEALARVFSRYGGWAGSAPDRDQPGGSAFTAEVATRIVLNTIAACAGAAGRRVECVLCATLDFFLRIIVRVHGLGEGEGEGAVPVSPLLAYRSRVYTPLRHSVPSGMVSACALGSELPESVNATSDIFGPLYGGDTCDRPFLARMLARVEAKRRQASSSPVVVRGPEPPHWHVTGIVDSDSDSEDEAEVALARVPISLRRDCADGDCESSKRRYREPRGSSESERVAQDCTLRILRELAAEAAVAVVLPFSLRAIAADCARSLDGEVSASPEGFSEGCPGSGALSSSTSAGAILAAVSRSSVLTRLASDGYPSAPHHADTLGVRTTAPYAAVCAAVRACCSASVAARGASQGGWPTRSIQKARETVQGCSAVSSASKEAMVVLDNEAVLRALREGSHGCRKNVRREAGSSLRSTAAVAGSTAPGTCESCVLLATEHCRRRTSAGAPSRVVVIAAASTDGAPADGSSSNKPINAVHCADLSACRPAEGDCVLFPPGEHVAPPGGLFIDKRGVCLIGCAHTQRLARILPSALAASDAGATVRVAAAEVAVEGLAIGARASQLPQHRTGPKPKKRGRTEGAQQTADGDASVGGIVVKGEGSSLNVSNCLVFAVTDMGSCRGGTAAPRDAAGIIVASKASLVARCVSVDGSLGLSLGLLVCGRGSASVDSATIRAVTSCGALVRSGGAYRKHNQVTRSHEHNPVVLVVTALQLMPCAVWHHRDPGTFQQSRLGHWCHRGGGIGACLVHATPILLRRGVSVTASTILLAA